MDTASTSEIQAGSSSQGASLPPENGVTEKPEKRNPGNSGGRRHQRKPRANADKADTTKVNSAPADPAPSKATKKPKKKKSNEESKKNMTKVPESETPSGETADSEPGGDMCFICTEPIVTYAVSSCDHRTCHLCALRLRVLYKTCNCAYCKAEQDTVVFTKDPEKPFDAYTAKDTPFLDKKLGLRFEDKQIQQDTMLILQFNCPDPTCTVACDGRWPELKRHVKKAHDRYLCDLCTRHKKIFAHEHTLYTWAQLHKHCKQGDKGLSKEDDTGFKGHPECLFCRVSFYGNDELFEHCRDKHEQCHLCVRQGIQHQYYENYDGLEDHFKREHYLCVYRECLDKKFVVFESDIDLKAHEVEVHGESISRLQRAKQSEARRIDINFDYGSRGQQQQQQRNRKGSSTGTSSRAQPQPSQSGDQDLQDVSNTTGNRQTFRKPAGFGGLSENWPELGTSTTSATWSASSTAIAASTETVSKHAAFLEQVFDMVKNHDKVARFRSLTTAFRKDAIDADTFVSHINELVDNQAEGASTIIRGVVDLLDSDERKSELERAWRIRQTTESESFPALESGSSSSDGHGTSSRVLAIKANTTKSGGTRATGKSKVGVWDRVASAASGASQGKSPQSPTPSAVRYSFGTPGLANGQRVAWVNSQGIQPYITEEQFPSLGNANPHFPSLPSSAPKQPLQLNLKKTNPPPTPPNAWINNSTASETDASPNDNRKKKKGKNKQLLFHVGL